MCCRVCLGLLTLECFVERLITSVLPSLSGGVLSVPSVFRPCCLLTARSRQVQVVEGLFREQGHQVQTSMAVSTTLVRCSVIIKKKKKKKK